MFSVINQTSKSKLGENLKFTGIVILLVFLIGGIVYSAITHNPWVGIPLLILFVSALGFLIIHYEL